MLENCAPEARNPLLFFMVQDIGLALPSNRIQLHLKKQPNWVAKSLQQLEDNILQRNYSGDVCKYINFTNYP